MDFSRARYTRFLVFFSFLLLLVCSPLAWAADQQGAPPAKHAAKSSRTAARKPAKTEAAVPPLVDLTEEAVQTSFDAFTIEWMKKLADTEEFHRTQAVVSQSPEGFAAEYVGYLPHRYIIIKKTDSKDTPFVGILTYYEKTMRCVGKTKEEALKGPFEASDSQQVSEIFRFTKGKWVY